MFLAIKEKIISPKGIWNWQNKHSVLSPPSLWCFRWGAGGRDTDRQKRGLHLLTSLCPQYLENHFTYHLLRPHFFFFPFHFLRKDSLSSRQVSKTDELLGTLACLLTSGGVDAQRGPRPRGAPEVSSPRATVCASHINTWFRWGLFHLHPPSPSPCHHLTFSSPPRPWTEHPFWQVGLGGCLVFRKGAQKG